MKISSFIFLLGLLICSCKAKDPAAELETDLKNTMQTYLYSGVNNDSSNVTYHVQDVTYFNDNLKKRYVCEFKVHLHVKAKSFDTTGIMKAYISKDFKTVQRLY